ncbi:MAG TPA: methyltransferase domain-containing protein [Jatrophihabitans sp.]|nr:methyltransferase domain-containing protein [Jatrophihabitans sp.]
MTHGHPDKRSEDSRQHPAGPPDEADVGTAADFWNDRYADRVWSSQVNAVLAAEVGELQPGTALDLGAGEGGDATWLARHGWQVAAADVSAVALARARADAERAGVARHISFVTVDEVFAGLGLVDADWITEVREVRERIGSSPDGRVGQLLDNVIRVRRKP